MSTIGNYSYTFGKQYKIYATNLTAYELNNYNTNKLPSNTIIISSPINNNGLDNGNPAILITDSNSELLQLTYSFNKSQFNIDDKTNTVSINTSEILPKSYTFDNTQFSITEDNKVSIKNYNLLNELSSMKKSINILQNQIYELSRIIYNNSNIPAS